MAVERVLSNLNLISFKTEEGLQNHIDELQDGDLVFTPDTTQEQLNNKADVSTVESLRNAENFTAEGKATLSGFAMPSDIYIDLTLGADGATYTAPADGYFAIRGAATDAGGFIVMSNKKTQMSTNPVAFNAGGGLQSFLPVKKGDVVHVWYGNFAEVFFRFIYANGAK